MGKNILEYDICIIGGGASGLMAAITAAKTGASVLVFETNSDLAHKILATGNGRCNFTNSNINSAAYHNYNYEYVEGVFAQFGYEDTLKFFLEENVLWDKRGELYYPRSNEASTIREALVKRATDLKVEFIYERKIKSFHTTSSGFIIDQDINPVHCKSLIIATGGNASKIPGSNGDGFYYASLLGHNVISPLPALGKLIISDKSLTKVSGVRTKARVNTYVEGQLIESHEGELQFSEDGISGIVVFQASRCISRAINEGKKQWVECDFLPEYTDEEARGMLQSRLQNDKSIDALKGIVPEKLTRYIYNKSQGELEICVKIFKHMTFVPVRVDDKTAQVTTGGVDMTEIHMSSLESKIHPGLYFAGEVLDVDGICGGYNLQWAWSSGYVAGRHASER
ncbi:MAG: aminoacetone oxidase family FAD-binding enzyme [Lachnospiraceae bacterium]|nr:aminoacetone oxidase family FAD-binding enzyme [Lachnospiraceae bacterium]